MDRERAIGYIHSNFGQLIKFKTDSLEIYTLKHITAEGLERLDFVDLKGNPVSIPYADIREFWVSRQ